MIRGRRGHTSGLAVPQFVIDAPGGGGKIPLLPEESFRRSRRGVLLKNFRGQSYFYPESAQRSGELPAEAPALQPAVARMVRSKRRSQQL